MRVDLPWQPLRHTLSSGGIAVVFVEVPAEIEAVRQLTRRICAELVASLGIEGLHMSRSATPGLGAVALCKTAAVGVDVECLRIGWVDDDLMRLALHPSEFAALRHAGEEGFFGIWVRKEAVLKALGIGLAITPNTFAVGAADTDWMSCTVSSVGTVMLRSLAAPKGFASALACSGSPDELQCWNLRYADRADSLQSVTSAPDGASGHRAWGG